MPSIHQSYDSSSTSEGASTGSSFDTFERNRQLDSYDVTPLPPDSSLQDEEYENDFDEEHDRGLGTAEFRRRRAEAQNKTSNLAPALLSRPQGQSTYDRILDFFQVENDDDDDDSLLSTSLSHSPSEYVKATCSTNNVRPHHSKYAQRKDPEQAGTMETRDAPSSPAAARRDTNGMDMSIRDAEFSTADIKYYDNDMERLRHDRELDREMGIVMSFDSTNSPAAAPPSWKNVKWPRYTSPENTSLPNNTKSPDIISLRSAPDFTTFRTGKRKVHFGSSPASDDHGATKQTARASEIETLNVESMMLWPASDDASLYSEKQNVHSSTTRSSDDHSTQARNKRSSPTVAYNFQPVHQVGEKIYSKIDVSPSRTAMVGTSTIAARDSPKLARTIIEDRTRGESYQFSKGSAQKNRGSISGVLKEALRRQERICHDESDYSEKVHMDVIVQSGGSACHSPLSSLLENDDPGNPSRGSRLTTGGTPNSSMSSQSSRRSSLGKEGLTECSLHDLCAKAKSSNDSSWLDAVHLLSLQPRLANSLDNYWMPLHISCLGRAAPPAFFVRALLLAAPEAARAVDNGGRLPLHLIAATSAEPEIMQVLVDKYPNAITEYDDKGMLPMHLLLKNETVHLSVHHVRILLGQTITVKRDTDHLKFSTRHGQHLNLSFEEINEIVYKDELLNENRRENHPREIQESLMRISRWKTKSILERSEGVDESNVFRRKVSALNPAALPASSVGQLALHMAASRKGTRPDSNVNEGEGTHDLWGRHEILHVILSAYPSALISKDSEGRTPLLVALCCTDCLPDRDMVDLLLGTHLAGFESPPVWAEAVAIHRPHVSRCSTPAMIMTNDTHQLPLHIIADQMTFDIGVMTAVYEAYTGAVHVRDVRGRTPLHLALNNFQRHPLAPKAFELLLTDRVAQIQDDDGMIPFDRFVDSFHCVRPEVSSSDCLNTDVYKQFFRASLNHSYCMGRPDVLLKRLKKFPSWLRRYTLSVGYVQAIIQERVTKAPHVAVILANGIALGTFLTLFRIRLDYHSRSEENQGVSVSLFCLAFFIVIFRIYYLFTAATDALLTPQRSLYCMFCVDVAGVSIAVTAVILMNGSNLYDVTILGTVATGLLWTGIICFLARWWLGMTVFVAGAVNMATTLFWPVICVAIVVVGFAQMFLTLNQTSQADECETILGGRALCNLEDAFTTIYLLILGTPLLDTVEVDEEVSKGTSALIAMFTVIAVLMVINLIIFVVQEASNMNIFDSALSDFWEFKLSFLYVTSDLSAAFDRLKDATICNVVCNVLSPQSLGNRWEACFASFSSHPITRHYDPCTGAPCVTGPYLFVRRLGILILIPVWIIVGIITLGLLWPPQVRSWLFRVPKTTQFDKTTSLTTIPRDMDILKEDLHELKMSSFDKFNGIERQILELRQIMMELVKQDRHKL